MSDEGVLRRLGVVGEGDVAQAVLGAAQRAGIDTVEGGARAMAEDRSVDAIVTIGETALVSIARHGVAAAVLPMGTVSGVEAVPGPAAERGLGSLVEGDFAVVERPVLGATTPRNEARALFDLTLVTEETARISEYTVRSGETTVHRFRADGVVVATPAGSPDYARAAGGPVLGAGTGVVSVVPVSPFATDTDHWILDDGAVVLRVEREEAAVELLADGRSTWQVDPGVDVSISPVETIRFLSVPEGRSPFEERTVTTDR